MFITDILRFLRYAEWALCKTTPPFPEHLFSSVKELSFAAVAEFSPIALRSRGEFGAGALERLVKAQYQDEFYRACYTVLKSLYLTSEWSGKNSRGRVDFQIRSQKWAIECVREGSKLDEHIARFWKGGEYHKWIRSGEIKDYIILDFQMSMPPEGKYSIPSLYFIVFSEDYRRYKTYNARGNKEGNERALTN